MFESMHYFWLILAHLLKLYKTAFDMVYLDMKVFFVWHLLFGFYMCYLVFV